MPAVNEGMRIDTVDQTDRPIGTVVRRDVFLVHANFRVAHIFVFNTAGELLIQRLALTRTRNPGAWGSSVAAYLFSHEDYAHAAQRRITEELGISGTPLQPVGKTEMVDDGCMKFISLFRTTNNGPFSGLDHQHIDQVRFEPIEAIRTSMKNRTLPFTPTFVHVFNFFKTYSLEP